MRKLLNEVVKKGLNVLEKNAFKKANAECPGFLFEPKIPKKLKKTFCLALASMLTAVTILAVGATDYKAADYNYSSWQTYANSSSNKKSSATVQLYATYEEYTWAVTSVSASSGYGSVTLDGVNNWPLAISGGKTLTQVGSRQFVIVDIDTSSTIYAIFTVDMSYDAYPTVFNGYIKIS